MTLLIDLLDVRKNNLTKIIRLTSDCPLVDPKLIMIFQKQLSKNMIILKLLPL